MSHFKADWWLNFDVEVTTLNGEMLGKIPARFDTDVPAAKADVVLRDGLAEVVLSHRGARLKFVTKGLPFSAPSDPLDCAALRLGSPTTSARVWLPTIAPADEPKATEAGARTVELLRSGGDRDQPRIAAHEDRTPRASNVSQRRSAVFSVI